MPVEHVDRDFLIRALEPILNDGATGGIRADGMLRRIFRRDCRRAAATAPPATKAATEARAILIARLEEMRVARHHLRRELLERGHVVHHPERAAMRRENDVAVLEREIMHGHDRQIELQLLPTAAVVEREPDAALRAGDKQTGALGILARDARELGLIDAGVDARPCFAKILRLPDQRSVVVELIAVRGAGAEVRRVDARDPRVLLHVRRSNSAPRLPAIARERNFSVIRAGPQNIGIQRRFLDHEYDSVVLDGSLVFRYRPTRIA